MQYNQALWKRFHNRQLLPGRMQSGGLGMAQPQLNQGTQLRSHPSQFTAAANSAGFIWAGFKLLQAQVFRSCSIAFVSITRSYFAYILFAYPICVLYTWASVIYMPMSLMLIMQMPSISFCNIYDNDSIMLIMQMSSIRMHEDQILFLPYHSVQSHRKIQSVQVLRNMPRYKTIVSYALHSDTSWVYRIAIDMPFTQTQIHMDGYNSKIIDLVAYTIYVSALQLAHVVFHGLAKVLHVPFFILLLQGSSFRA